MVWGQKSGCHQRADRSFFWRGFQFPVCARCTGVVLSYLASIPLYVTFGGSYYICVIAMAIMLFDWLIQHVGIRESTNLRRLLTGICGGYGIMTMQLLILVSVIRWVSGVIE